MHSLGLRKLLAISALGLGVAGCGDDQRLDDGLIDGVFSQEEWDVIATLSPVPESPPPDTTNRYADDAAAAALGQRLFSELSHAGPISDAATPDTNPPGAPGEVGKIGCVSCHHGDWLIDTRTRPPNASFGANYVSRNAPSMVNVELYDRCREVDGRFAAGWQSALFGWGGGTSDFALETNTNVLAIAQMIRRGYRAEFEAIFYGASKNPNDPCLALPDRLDPAHPQAWPDAKGFGAVGWEAAVGWLDDGVFSPSDRRCIEFVAVNTAKALHAYQRKLISRDAPFDRYVAGNRGAISESAKRGLKLFVGQAGCAGCHSGPLFTRCEFFNLGLSANGVGDTFDEQGAQEALQYDKDFRFNVASIYSDDPATGQAWLNSQDPGRPGLLGAFRPKSLRHVAETPPYMHDGQLQTLRDVIEFYNAGGHAPGSGYMGQKDERIRPLGLPDAEMNELIAFLATLTGAPVPAALRPTP